jgi:cytochrome P450
LDNRDHRRRRQAIGQVLSDRTLRQFEPIMSAQIDIFLRQLLVHSQQGEVINMTLVTKRLAMDIVGHLAFGCDLNTQTEVTNRFIIDVMGKQLYMANLYFTWPSLRIFLPIIRWLLKKKALTFYKAIHKMIVTRQAEPKNEKPDFYSFAIGHNEIGDEGLHHSEFFSEAIFFILAGGSTVSTAMCAVFFYIVRHPHVYARLAEEIRSTFSSGRDIRYGPELAGCKYLRAVIDESLRIAPPTLNVLWRKPESPKQPLGPFTVDGHIIPPGTEVGVHLYSFLHDEKYFPEPFKFRPERWMEPEKGSSNIEERQEALAIMRRAQVSFGLGHRNCAGKSMAYMENSLVISRCLWYFDFELTFGPDGKLSNRCEGNNPWDSPDQFQLGDKLAADHNGPYISVKLRGDYYKEL